LHERHVYRMPPAGGKERVLPAKKARQTYNHRTIRSREDAKNVHAKPTTRYSCVHINAIPFVATARLPGHARYVTALNRPFVVCRAMVETDPREYQACPGWR
jgi:hypothetical protein